ncbi:MAG: PAS domain-containing protein [Ignavibacteriaceae bacterium]|nr:PAS domain-containing protein [Ignavibacteriaceae bacterium]
MHSDLLQVVFDTINLEIWILDKEFRFLTFNKKFKEMVKSLHNYNIVEGTNLEDLINSTGLEIWKNRYESVFDGETKSFFIKQIIEGKEVYFDVVISPIFDEEKRVQLVCGISRPFDPENKSITELTSLANLFLGNLHNKFLNTINWELKAPINSALEYLETISPDNTSIIRKEEILDLKATIEILKVKLDIVNEFSKIDIGELNLSEQRFNISELLEKIESISYQLKSNITDKFKISFSSELPVEINGDKSKIQNLIFIVIEGIFQLNNYQTITMSVSLENYADSISTLFLSLIHI